MIPAGAMATMFAYTVTLINDGIVEDDETFVLELPDQATVPYTIGMPSTITVTIVNDDRK